MSLYSDRVAQDSPLFYFENNSSGVNNTGSITPSIVTGSSTSFTGSGGVQNSPYLVNAAKTGEYGFEYSDSTTIFNDRVFSITGWFKVASTDIDSTINWIFHAGTTANGVTLQKTNQLYVGALFNNVQVNTSSAISYDVWHHVAVTMDTTNLKLYLDGSLVHTVSSPGSLTMDSLVKYWMRATTSGTPRNGAKGNFDEWAVFNTTLSSTTISEHYEAGFGVKYNATAVTASALAVQPTVSAIKNVSYTATAVTASAASGDHYNSTRDSFTLLDGYLSTLTLEQWYKFDQAKAISNYGTGGASAYSFTGNSVSNITSGIQGQGALRVTGGTTGAVYAVGTNTFATEFTDDNFSLGFWLKKSTAEFARVYTASTTGSENLTIQFESNGRLTAATNLNNTTKAVTTSSSIADGNWHYVAVTLSSGTFTLYVDNVSIGTQNLTHSMSGFTTGGFGIGDTSVTEQMYISQFYVATSANVGTTQIGNIWTYGQPVIQGSAAMAMPKFSRDNALNTYITGKSPAFYFKMDEATGAPQNIGSVAVDLSITGTNFTQNISSPNYKAFNSANRDTQYSGSWSATSGTFSSANQQTILLYAKLNSGNQNALLATAAFGSITGNGLVLQQLANGTIRFRVSNATLNEDATTTASFADGNYHMFVAVKNGSSTKLYVDGIERASNSSGTITLTDSGVLAIGGLPNLPAAAASRDITIDEFAVLPTAFTQADALEAFQKVAQIMDWTASATSPSATVSAGFGPTINATALTATANMGPVFPPIAPATANTLFLNPNYEAIKNASNAADPMTASAQGENPGWNIGENNAVIHMNASAQMGDARALIPGFWNASPMIANPATIVDPALSSTRGALIRAQVMPVKAIFATPPAYKLITDDIWYQKLYLQHSVVHGEEGYTAGSSSAYAFLKLFDDVTANLSGAVTNKLTNNLPWSIVIDNPDTTATTTTYATASNEFLTATPTPLLEVGTYDDYERKSVRFRNIQFKIAEDIYKADGPYSLEFTFKTTKANQVIAQGLQRSFYGNQSATSSIGLIDGKLFASRATQPIGSARIFAHPDNQSLVTMNTAYGNKSIADGAWHHIIIQYGFDGRVQFWIDGQLDIQFFSDSQNGKGAKLRPYIMGSNHTNTRWQSDFETSAWSYDAAFFVESDEITDHYTASIKYEPVHAEPSTATAEMPEPTVAGNRPRALMLYFWPTSTEQITNQSYSSFTSNESPEELETIDYFTAAPQQYEGWDVFPVDVTGRYVSDLVKPEAYGVENIQLTTLGGFVDITEGAQQKIKVNKRKTFRNILTDAPRYIDLINDIDLTKFDMIMFKNYPNDPGEKDAFSTNEVVDAYFNLRESAIFEEFLKSLRAAVDTGLSLIVTNPQLALDLKIVDRVETVPDMDDLSGYESDPYAPTQVTQAASLPVTSGSPYTHHWWDTWKNNRARVVNTQDGLTNNAGLVRTQIAFWNNDDEGVRYGGPDRPFHRYEHKNALTAGDEFLLSSEPVRTTRKNFQASPITAVKAGRVITAFANTVRRGLDSITNPYKDYAIAIAVNPGDVVDGKQIGGKIFVNFTENINQSIETGDVDLRSDYWINYAYDNGAIDADQRDAYLAAEWNTNTTPYWSSDGMYILVQVSELEDENLQKKGTQTAARKTRKVNKNGGISFQSVGAGTQYFALQYSYQYPRATFEVPSILTNGFRWLSNREVLEGTVIRPTALTASAQMPNALGVPDKVNNFTAQSMVATATIEETEFSSGAKRIAALPATATATIVKPGSTIGVAPMTANAILRLDSKASVAAEDQVTLYLIHVDPILYIREDVIK